MSDGSTKARARRWVRWLGGSALALVLLVASFEVAVRLAAWLLANDPSAPLGTGRIVVLCVGDSHTWGGGQGYPAKLAELLAERSPRYAVVNLGVPGTNTAQIRNRLVRYLDLYQPRVLIVWSGLNNSWNLAERSTLGDRDADALSLPSRLLAQSRTVRLLRAWRHQQRIERLLDGPEAPVLTRSQEEGESRPAFRRRLGEVEDVFPPEPGEHLSAEETTRVTEADFRWIMERARERGIAMAVVTYAFGGGAFGATNVGIERAAEAAGIPLVRSGDAVKRLVARHPSGEAPKAFDHTVHPTQPLYDEVAVMLLEALDARGAL